MYLYGIRVNSKAKVKKGRRKRGRTIWSKCSLINAEHSFITYFFLFLFFFIEENKVLQY